MADEPEVPTLYIVVCTRYHVAVGPYTTPEQAVDVATVRTAESPTRCTYVPVMLNLPPEAVMRERPLPERGTRGYL
jgi:hypothetical protein